jgi:hypothetical protein
MGRACGRQEWGRRYLQRFQFGNLKERDHFEDLGIKWKKTKQILNVMVGHGLGLFSSGYRKVVGCCDRNDAAFGTMRCG